MVIRKYSEVIICLVASFFIGIVVGFIEVTIINYRPEYAMVILRDGLIGLFIGVVSRYLFILLYAKKENVMLCFATVFIVIAVISLMPFLYFSVVGSGYPPILVVAVLITAETLGMGLSYISYHHSLVINNLLINKKMSLEHQLGQ
jgi:hypothetical protein